MWQVFLFSLFVLLKKDEESFVMNQGSIYSVSVIVTVQQVTGDHFSVKFGDLLNKLCFN